MKIWVILISLCVAPGMLWAQSEQDTVISLSAEASAEVPNDEVVVRFRVEAQGKHLDALRKRVNQITARIKHRLASEKGVKLQTQSRRVDPVWKPNQYQRKRDGWVVVQQGMIVSRKLDRVPQWLDAIEQAGAMLQGLNFRVSNALRREVQAKLRVEAIRQFRRKASAVAKALDASAFYILNLNTASSYNPPHRPMYAMRKSVSAEAAPALSAGDSQVSVQISGSIAVAKQAFKVAD